MSLITFKTLLDLKPDANVRIIIRVMVTESLTFPSYLSNEPRYFYAQK